jgi:hypothetical protein
MRTKQKHQPTNERRKTMNIDIKRWTPWNWLKGEEQQEGRNLPARQNDREIGFALAL